MSRSALWRQEGNVKEREERAESLYQMACEEGRGNKSSALPLWGPDNTFHWNPVLLRNTVQSPYFQKCCTDLLNWNAVIDEIYYEVKHLHPFATACTESKQSGSTAFCLLLRLLTLRMTAHQMDLALKHPDSVYIRGIAFLYLRYAGPPDQIWSWIEPYVYEEQTTLITDASHHNAAPITLGEFVRKLFSERDYCGTPLPRFPIQVERDLLVKLLQADEVSQRAKRHFHDADRMKMFQTLGCPVMALYEDAENPIQWYSAVVDRVVMRDDQTGQPLAYPKFVVTFTEYGNTETVLLGEIDVLDGEWKHTHLGHAGHGGRKGVATMQTSDYNGHRREGDEERDLYEEVRRRERETVTAEKGWARRPPSTKSSLSRAPAKPGYASHHGREREQDDPRRNYHHRRETKSPPILAPAGAASHPASKRDELHEQQQRKRSPEELAAIAEKKRKLLAKYG